MDESNAPLIDEADNRKLRETADDYPHIVARLSDRVRVMDCPTGFDWNDLERETAA